MKVLARTQLPTAVGNQNLEEVFYARYDEFIRVLCPDYDENLDLMVANVPAGTESLLDVGCGTGNLLSRLAVRCPDLKRMVGVDFSDRVLDRAREKLTAIASRLELVKLDICRDELPDASVCTSALTLHNIEPAVQMTIYLKILQKTQCLIHYDLIRGATREEENEKWKYLQWWMTEQQVPREIQSLALKHMREEDYPLTIEQHQRLCDAAGMSFQILRASPGFILFKAERRRKS